MKDPAIPLNPASNEILRLLSDFRFELRRFLQFSELAATAAGLQPQQHQLLLQVAGAPEHISTTIAYVAERLGIRHNSAVELVDRCVREDLLVRAKDPEDQRRAILHLTRKGKRILGRLSDDHARELTVMATRLIESLKQIRQHIQAEVR